MIKGSIILSGERDSGKSTRLLNLFNKNKAKIKISGIITLPFIQKGVKIGYNALFLNRSRASKPVPFFRTRPFTGSTKWRRFFVDFGIFKKFGEIAEIRKSDLFLLDEVGPLELEEKKGFYPYLHEIYSNNRAVIAVVRPSLISGFLKEIGRFHHRS